MIKIEILSSPDFFICEEIVFHKNTINLGKKESDINIDDSDLKNHHLSIEVTSNNQLIVEPGSKVKSYFLNKKITTTKMKIGPQDEITIGKTKIKVIEFKYQSHFDIKKERDQKIQDLSQGNTDKWKVIEKLQESLNQ